jgi:hypothetical protein
MVEPGAALVIEDDDKLLEDDDEDEDEDEDEDDDEDEDEGPSG